MLSSWWVGIEWGFHACFLSNFKANLKDFLLWIEVGQIINNRPFFSSLAEVGGGKKNSLAEGGTMQHSAAEAQPYLHTECSGNCLPAVFCVYALFIGPRSLSTACHLLRLSKPPIRSSSRWLINLRRKRKIKLSSISLGGIKCIFVRLRRPFSLTS